MNQEKERRASLEGMGVPLSIPTATTETIPQNAARKNQNPATQQSQQKAPTRAAQNQYLDFPDLANHCQGTYEALSYVVQLIREKSQDEKNWWDRQVSIKDVTEAEMDQILNLLESHQVDLSSRSQFPLDAPDLDETLLLLARLQNRASQTEQKCKHFVPTIRDITEFALLDRSKKTYRYNVGEWVEVRGNSMRYRMEIIHNIVKRNDECIYETTVDNKLTINELRWPREALRRIFGMGPWAWQQWAMLKLEDKLVFKEGHAHDFELLNIKGYAEELWALWLNDKRNTSFKALWDRVGTSGQDELAKHILAPFDLLEEVIHEEDKWNFADAAVNIFTYLSLLGSGFLDGAIVFFLQVAIPSILYFYYTSDRDIDDIAVGTREMLFVVLIYYLYKIVRDTGSYFHEITGLASSTLSRVQSLRTVLWENGNDSFAQSMGYTTDRFMNTGYICYLYMFNIWILCNVSDPFELLGSVIFFEFLFGLDEEIADSRWWDTRGKRFLKAGVVGVIIQNSIRRERCKSSEFYLKKSSAIYTDAERQLLKKRMENKGLLDDTANNAYKWCTFFGCDYFGWLSCCFCCFCCCSQGITFLRQQSDEESDLLTVTERVDQLRRRESNAPYIFKKPRPVRFSGSLTLSYLQIFSVDLPIFERHRDLRAWSQWEELIFLFPTPKLVPSEYRAGTKLQLDRNIGDGNAVRMKRGYSPGTSRRKRFVRHILEVLSCRYARNSFRTGSEHEHWSFYLTRNLEGFVSWLSYVVQMVFPFFVLGALLLICSENGYCALRKGECDPPDPVLNLLRLVWRGERDIF